MAHALIVDDDPPTRAALAEVAEMRGFSVATAGSLEEARSRLAEKAAAVVLIDLMLPDGKGLDLLEDFEGQPRPEIILITGHVTVDSAIDALRGGVLDYLPKPVDMPRLKTVLENVARTLALKEEITDLRGELRTLGRFGKLIGSSTAMQRVYDMMAKVAPTEATVLITGESGTGKEMVAQSIHELGLRRKHPFLPINCSAVPANLIESELFGHERGSFTGATQLHRGYFERASGGTLFLDEITEMSLDLQVKLLRVLETGLVSRIGGEDPIAVDVRVLAATNRSPESAVKDGRLRQDLYYRLNVFPLPLPPLRDREGDIELLAEYFLDRLNQEQGTSKRFGAEARRRMNRHPWPGNVREIRNVVQRAFIMADELIELDGLAEGASVSPSGEGAGTVEGIRVGSSLEEIERQLILATLDHCKGDKKMAAQMLGISLKTLYNRLNLYGSRGAVPASTTTG